MSHEDPATKILKIQSYTVPDNNPPKFIADSTSWTFKLSDEVSFIPEYPLEGGQKSQELKLIT